MKHNYFRKATFFVLALFSSLSFSQDILWEKSYGGREGDYLFDVQPTADYGFILAGSSISGKSGNKVDVNKGDFDYYLVKMGEDGDLEWQKSFGGSGSDLLNSVRPTNDGGFILGGTSNSNKGRDKKEKSLGGNDYWIIKLDAGGNEQWQKTIGGTGNESIVSAFQTKDGGYFIGGTSASDKSANKVDFSRGNLDYWVLKLDDKGDIEWQKSFGGKYADILRSMEQTNDGGFLLGGYSNSPASGEKNDTVYGIGDFWIIRLDIKGNLVWEKTYGGNGDDQLYCVHQSYDGNFIVGGSSNSGCSNNKLKSSENGTDFWVLKLDRDGNSLWQEVYDFGKVDMLTSITENSDHSMLIAGYVKGNPLKSKSELNDYVALKIDEKGEQLWSRIVGSDGEDILRKLIETRDGGYLLAGTSDPECTVVERKKSLGKISDKNVQMPMIDAFNSEIEKSVQEGVNDVNTYYQEQIDTANSKANKTLNKTADNIKLVDNSQSILNTINTGGLPGSSNSQLGDSAQKGPKSGLGPSGDKLTNFGSRDFWVVKLKDKQKPKVEKSPIEASPNPTDSFTNIIIGHEFTNGMATIVDLGGHILKQFSFKDQTIPVDLSEFPEGVYVINIKTNKQQNSVKIIKTNIR